MIGYGVTKEEAARFGLPCGGNLRLVQEPLRSVEWIDQLLERTARHELVARALNLDAARWLESRLARREVRVRRRELRALFGPRWRLLIIGAGQLSRVLAQMALALDFEVICCDPREEYHLTWDVPGTTFSKAMPDDLVLRAAARPAQRGGGADARPQARRHGAARGAEVAGVLRRRARLARQHRQRASSGWRCSTCRPPRSSGCTARSAWTSGSKTPAEIAVSILAEIVAVKNGVALVQKKEGSALPVSSSARVSAG